MGPPKVKSQKIKKKLHQSLSWFSDPYPEDVYFPHFNTIIHYYSPSWIAHLSQLRHVLLVVCVCVSPDADFMYLLLPLSPLFFEIGSRTDPGQAGSTVGPWVHPVSTSPALGKYHHVLFFTQWRRCRHRHSRFHSKYSIQ